MATPLYLDHNATAPLGPGVLQSMLPFLEQQHFNPSGDYGPALEVRAAIEGARREMANLVGAAPRQIAFTSGGTESTHAAFHYALDVESPQDRAVVVSAVEHSATKGAAKAWQGRGFEVCSLDVNTSGQVAKETLERVLADKRPTLVSTILANNETGVIQHIHGWAELIHAAGAHWHVDAVQAPGKLALDAPALGADWISFSGHKFGAPKGIGALFTRKDSSSPSWLVGGGQEHGKRGGTENVAGIIGLGRAAKNALEQVQDRAGLIELAHSRDELEAHILEGVPGSRVHGSQSPRVPNTTQLFLPGCPSEILLPLLEAKGVLASAGSACDATHHAPSEVLMAMGCTPEEAACSLRISLPFHFDPEARTQAACAIVEAANLLAVHNPQ
ncbi:MAG: cysteine desulfurase [bacterium]|nr:cysteine desulfurase [bacterium]